MQDSTKIEMVAVKYLKDNAEEEIELTFQRELEILSNFDHPNVIPLVGVCLDKSASMCIVLGLFFILRIFYLLMFVPINLLR